MTTYIFINASSIFTMMPISLADIADRYGILTPYGYHRRFARMTFVELYFVAFPRDQRLHGRRNSSIPLFRREAFHYGSFAFGNLRVVTSKPNTAQLRCQSQRTASYFVFRRYFGNVSSRLRGHLGRSSDNRHWIQLDICERRDVRCLLFEAFLFDARYLETYNI